MADDLNPALPTIRKFRVRKVMPDFYHQQYSRIWAALLKFLGSVGAAGTGSPAARLVAGGDMLLPARSV